MRDTRALDQQQRRLIYRQFRIDDQRHWYMANAYRNATAYRRWNLTVVLLESAGFGLGLAHALGAFGRQRISALAIVAVVVTAITAWSQAKQFGSLAAAYVRAGQELSSIAELVDQSRSEPKWAAFVASAELAISREHRMWQSLRSVE
jgi:hypothetical protein